MTDRISTALATIFRAEMARQQIKQTQLAAMTGLSQSVISRRLNAKDSLDIAEADAIIDALGMDWTETMAEAFKDAAESGPLDTKDSYGLAAHDPKTDPEAEQEALEQNP